MRFVKLFFHFSVAIGNSPYYTGGNTGKERISMKPLAENVHLTPRGDALEIVDQTLLPGEKRFITLNTR